MKKFSLKIVFLLSTIFLLSSCMMMGPGHHMTSSIDQQQVYYDPVCGNHIDSISKDLSWRYKEEIYYFHSNECMSKFMENPINYVTINDQRAKNYFLWGLGSIGMTAMMILMIF